MSEQNKRQFMARYGTAKDLDHLIDHEADGHVVHLMPKNPAFTQDHLERIVNHKKDWMRQAAGNIHGLADNHLQKLAQDPHEPVRYNAKRAIHARMTGDQLAKIVHDPSQSHETTLSAFMTGMVNSKFSWDHIHSFKDHPTPRIRTQANDMIYWNIKA